MNRDERRTTKPEDATDKRNHLKMRKLKITNCKNHIEELTLTEGSHTIGRSLNSTLRLESNEISRLHARLLVGSTDCEIIDEGSTNGTLINGKRITSHRLTNGDRIQIGKFNLEFISEGAHHYPTDFLLEDTTKKGRKIIRSLFATALILASFIIYQKISWNSKWLKSQIRLAETTSHYLAEKNKEALYLGEYTSLNLTDLPSQIAQAAIIDRHGNLRIYQPHTTEPIIRNTQINSTKLIRKDKHTLEIYTPIYYNFTRVGTLWMLYALYR